jgi:hypothetical protein
MAYLQANTIPDTTSATGADTVEREQRKKAVQKFLARAEVSMVRLIAVFKFRTTRRDGAEDIDAGSCLRLSLCPGLFVNLMVLLSPFEPDTRPTFVARADNAAASMTGHSRSSGASLICFIQSHAQLIS